MKDYRNVTSNATTEPIVTPGAITAAPPKKGRPTREIKLEAEINDLRKELVDSMEGRDSQVEALALQRESIAELRGQVATLKKLIDRRGDEHHAEVRRGIVEIEALKALVKLYI